MLTLIDASINNIYIKAINHVIEHGVITKSRLGETLDIGPAFFEIPGNTLHILTLKKRGFNPFFAIIEAAWFIAGKRCLEDLERVLGHYHQFSDDGLTLNGAYGYRMQHQFGLNQLEETIKLLKLDPESRRAVITLYSPYDINNHASKDIPCNTTIYFKVRNNALNMTVLNRSNDLFLGIPYNIFMFNILQQYISQKLGTSVGIQRHYTDCLHLYTRDLLVAKEIITFNSYDSSDVNLSDSALLLSKLSHAIIDEASAISRCSINEINDEYLKGFLSTFIDYKKSNDKYLFAKSLPSDTMGRSALLWAFKDGFPDG